MEPNEPARIANSAANLEQKASHNLLGTQSLVLRARLQLSRVSPALTAQQSISAGLDRGCSSHLLAHGLDRGRGALSDLLRGLSVQVLRERALLTAASSLSHGRHRLLAHEHTVLQMQLSQRARGDLGVSSYEPRPLALAAAPVFNACANTRGAKFGFVAGRSSRQAISPLNKEIPTHGNTCL